MGRYVFGPVPSRRLGRSLGVDVIPMKTCTQRCLYCQLHRDAPTTEDRRSYVPVEEVVMELSAVVAEGTPLDVVTFSGSGEPTLNADLGVLIERARELTERPVVLITNGTLLYRPEVRRELSLLHRILPSLDAADEEAYQAVCRPHPGATARRLVEGLTAFRHEHPSIPMHLEVMLVDGLNDHDTHVDRLVEALTAIQPSFIELNTVVRPPMDHDAHAVPRDRLEAIAARLDAVAPTSVIAPFVRPRAVHHHDDLSSAILTTLRRRPCAQTELADSLAADEVTIGRRLLTLVKSGLVSRTSDGYYVAEESQATEDR